MNAYETVFSPHAVACCRPLLFSLFSLLHVFARKHRWLFDINILRINISTSCFLVRMYVLLSVSPCPRLRRSGSLAQSSTHISALSGPCCSCIYKLLQDLIASVYASKEKYDRHRVAQRLPSQTLARHLDDFLVHRCCVVFCRARRPVRFDLYFSLW